MENAYVWAHEICGELQISKISWGSQKWAEFLNEIVLAFSRSIGTARFHEKKSDFASVLLYTFSGLSPLRDGLIFRGLIGRCAPYPFGETLRAVDEVPPQSLSLPRGGTLSTAPQGGPPPGGGHDLLVGLLFCFFFLFFPLPSLCPPPLSSFFFPSLFPSSKPR